MLKKTFFCLIATLLLGVTGLYATGNEFVLTAIKRTYLAGTITANINDHIEFDSAKIEAGVAQPFTKHPNYNKTVISSNLRDTLERNNAIAYLVLKDGQLLTEHYFQGYHERSKTNSFSMAKTVTTLLVGAAIDDGLITSMNQAITDFMPEFADDPLGRKATLANLSLMNSGHEWTEKYYTPFSPTVELYYGNDVETFLLNTKFSSEPGRYWEYSSASSQLLAIALRRALRNKNSHQTLSGYLSTKLWKPLGMNDHALWHTDSTGMELAYCCLNTNARNYAKLGQLMLNEGLWNGQQLISTPHLAKMIQPDGHAGYGYSTWLSLNTEPRYYWFSGHLGQYILVIPEHNTVIVKLGEARENLAANSNYAEVELPVLVQETIKALP